MSFGTIYNVQEIDGLNDNGARRQKILSSARTRLEGGAEIAVHLAAKSTDNNVDHWYGLNDNRIPSSTWKANSEDELFWKYVAKSEYVIISKIFYTSYIEYKPIGVIGKMPREFFHDIQELLIRKHKLKDMELKFNSFYEIPSGKKYLLGCRVVLSKHLD